MGGCDAARSKPGSLLTSRPLGPTTLGPVKNKKPLIGILTQPCHTCPGKSYIAAGFVKWIEAAGGRAVPIRFYASDEELYRIFKSVNGLVFPGGLTWLWLDAPYVITARKLFNWAVQANDAGDVFPIHGTCLGFQLLHILASNISRNVLLVDTDSVAHPTTLKFWGNDAADNSRMFASMPVHLRDALESPEQNIVLQNHMYGMPPAMYTKHPVLASWYNIISTSMDRNGTGTQWHPEKPPSEFGMLEVPHSIEAISVSQHLANMFMELARRSSHAPESKEEELALLIYDTCPVFSERFETTDEENYDGPDITYYFDKPDHPPSGPDDSLHKSKARAQLQQVAQHPDGFFLG
ncbi:folate gamma-glutamyl hydrolase [Haematococcus lacustris]|uniref:folate gamma-glutamyl hydrolase n=1 Tax=Haematococcus lacustris TaxID=44745 RepID=A0A6A0A0C9_HAELA|nr:folate gamma-glutamyl hydrolase [Haematococcus lacustris]